MSCKRIWRNAKAWSRGNTCARRCVGGQHARTVHSGDGSEQLRSTHHGQELAKRGGCFFGTAAVTQPGEKANITDLIAQIQPRLRGRPPKPNSASQLILLVTPSLAKHAADPTLPLQVIDRFDESGLPSQPVDAFTAVVDRLPVPEASYTGREGIAYAWVTDAAPLYTDSQIPLRKDTTKAGAISFDITPCKPHPDDERQIQRPFHVTLQIQLAQTIFSTGLPSTLTHIRYRFDAENKQYVVASAQQLESQTLHLPVSTFENAVGFRAPLVPLTPFREITSSMGNIVRRLAPILPTDHRPVFAAYGEKSAYDGGAGKYRMHRADAFPASQELEAAVSDYFNALGIQPEPVQVWALVLPRSGGMMPGEESLKTLLQLDQEAIRVLWSPTPVRPHDRHSTSPNDTASRFHGLLRRGQLIQALWSGARLIKVLSGGGGWGKKAGLLSFDPDVSYSTREVRGDHGWDFSLDSAEALQDSRKQALGEVVKEGEVAAFFLARSENSRTATQQGFPDDDDDGDDGDDDEHTRRGAILFGSIPRSVENVANASHDGRRRELAHARVRHYQDCFGALSEGGLAMTAARDGQILTQTKLDMPYGRLGIEHCG